MKGHKKKKGKHQHRNASRGAEFVRKVSKAGGRLARRRAPPPDWKTTLAAVVGGAGSAVLSGLAVNQSVVSAEGAALSMIGIGAATAYFADGTARVVGNSMASAGTGQYALAKLARRAAGKAPATVAPAAAAAAPAPALPAPASAPGPATTPDDYRKDPFGGGYVTGLFRDAANELELIDDEERRMGARDAEEGVDVYDLDDLAA